MTIAFVEETKKVDVKFDNLPNNFILKPQLIKTS